MRTNIDIDDKLMGQKALRELRGKVAWRGHDDDWFASDEEILKKRREANQKTEPNLDPSAIQPN